MPKLKDLSCYKHLDELAKAKQEGRKEAAREIREDLVDDYDIDELSGEFYYVVKVCDGILNEGAEVNHAECD